ncbi:hypothetical protein KPATCC21470_8644 [Kitasatospora purpeofusca]
MAGPGEDQLGFAVCSALTDTTRTAFSAWLRLRHHERGEHADLANLTSVAVLLTPRTDGFRKWDTTLSAVRGDPELAADELRTYRNLWNRPDGQDGNTSTSGHS